MNYLIYKNSYWKKTGVSCKRCGGDILEEIKKDGTSIDHFCCTRIGCTYPNYESSAVEIKDFLSKIKI